MTTKRVLRIGFIAACSLLITGALLVTAAMAQQQDQPGLVSFHKSALSIKTATGAQKFTVEVALDDRQHAQGLMYRQNMAADAGMLFTYRQEQSVRMWMKNTVLPLDMVFIKTDGTIAAVHERAVPQSLDIIPSGEPIKYVLELNGGTISRLGIKPGDRIDGEALAIP